MGFKSWIINKLEKDIEPSAGHIELENLTEEDREELFKQFGEGDVNLTEFLRQSYKSGLPSIFCCSGHGIQSAYVTLKITDENINIARKMGKILSKQGISTNFTDDHIRGKYVVYRSMKTNSTEWLNTATQILANPELFEDVEPDIYYHEKMYPSRKPLAFDLKKRLLSYLRGTKQIEETTTVSSIQKIKKNSWELSDKEKSSIKEHQEFSDINKNSKKLYEESIILIGPSGAGKSTVAEELRKKTGMQRLCLDIIANRARDTGFTRNFKNADEFNSYMILETLERVKKDGSYGIVDFGAGHSVYDNQEIFERVKAMLKPFKNIVLLLPDKDEEKSLDIMKNRATGDTRDNKKFFESPCNKELATMIIYGNNRQPLEIAEEIMQCIKKRKEHQIEIE
jgi:shikimate kinase